jgi:chemotaxis protein methyltransferase CheR
VSDIEKVANINTYDKLRQFIEKRCGIEIPVEKVYLIENRLASLLFVTGASDFEQLYNMIILKDNPELEEAIIDAITTNETFWFRDVGTWKNIEEIYLPKFVEKIRNKEKKKIRIWSAAASTGQEAYSMAILIDRWLKKNNITDVKLDDFEIFGTDISVTALETAKKGRYDSTTIIRGLDKDIKELYFQKHGTVWSIKEEIKKHVEFKQFNLQNSYLYFGEFDLIFCRYVLIYFTKDLVREILFKVYDRLGHDGVLFIGASEIYDALEEKFEIKQNINGSYYVKRR